MGEIGPKIPIEDVVTGLGVKHLLVTDTYEYDKTLELLKEAVKHVGPSVLIARRPCALFPKKMGIISENALRFAEQPSNMKANTRFCVQHGEGHRGGARI